MTARRGLIWPLLFIVAGAVLLAANFGVLPPIRVTDVLNLWPLLLVLLGIDIALARRAPMLALGAELVVVALGVALVIAQPAYPGWFDGGSAPGGAQSVSAPRTGEGRLHLRLSGGAGSFTVHGGASDLVNASSDRGDLVLRTERSGSVTTVRVSQDDAGRRFGAPSGAHVDAAVASQVPTSLDLDAGAGEFVVDLRDVLLSDARISIGAASLRVVLPKPTGDVQIAISAGASSVVIEVPDGVEARVTTNGALLSVRSENPRIGGLETTHFATATDRVTVRVSAGASSIVLR